MKPTRYCKSADRCPHHLRRLTSQAFDAGSTLVSTKACQRANVPVVKAVSLVPLLSDPLPGDSSRSIIQRERSGKRENHMTKPAISGIAPFFIVKNVPAALSFYRDRLGFDIAFQGPSDDDIFFGIVRRGAAMIMLKESVWIQCRTTREISNKALPAGTLTLMSRILMRWRKNSRRAMSSFFSHSRTTVMVCGDLKSRTPTAMCCSSGILVHERRFKP
jgi:hypothetical protein